jgi:hypothetical protein
VSFPFLAFGSRPILGLYPRIDVELGVAAGVPTPYDGSRLERVLAGLLRFAPIQA